MENIDKHQLANRNQDQQKDIKPQLEDPIISQTERLGSYQNRIRIQSQQQQSSSNLKSAASLQTEEKSDKCGLSTANTTIATGMATQSNNTQSFNSINTTNQTIDYNTTDNNLIKKKIMSQRPIPIKSIKRAESTNENFLATQDKNPCLGLHLQQKMNGTITHFGSGKLYKSNPLDLLKNIQKETIPLKLTSALSCNIQSPLQNSNLQQGNINFSHNFAFKNKINNDQSKLPTFNQCSLNIEKDSYIQKDDKNTESRQSTDSNNNRSFQIEDLPFKQKNTLRKANVLSSSTSVQSFNLINQQSSQFQQKQQQQQSQQQGQVYSKNVTLTNFHQVTQFGLNSVSASNSLIQQEPIFSSNAVQKKLFQASTFQKTSEASFPQVICGDQSTKNKQSSQLNEMLTNNQQITQLTSGNNFSINNPLQNNTNTNNKIIKFTMRKSNLTNLTSNVLLKQQRPLYKSVSAEQQSQQNEEKQDYEQPLELNEQEELEIIDEFNAQEIPIQFNIEDNEANHSEKNNLFFNQNINLSNKNSSNNNTLNSFNDQTNQNNQGNFSKIPQNQVKRKINEAMSKATYYSSNFEKQKLFEQQNEEEEANFRELCQVFSIM
ncbi:hypothetical protein TTHERM_00046070 (macronuclear) [Tetrahymena thermophila SB210]|uniref:Uncharacterized protein n=1 Tax=Tetrahymena thermophila (strain SB210) TaxID=312017 RepID=Q23DT4_TETTS|nr:hypothetical protein TTHERM_00046070 [Tetrahymena thermophila SB210]EAR94339.3 hypothetical protein TTHERM_00046070 [Tetrahymena thermophila SB210]|eukprot:XP_001014602.3 hypothetical protein TTHERM_00046070 [Tetrahymena thermophila SB210]